MNNNNAPYNKNMPFNKPSTRVGGDIADMHVPSHDCMGMSCKTSASPRGNTEDERMASHKMPGSQKKALDAMDHQTSQTSNWSYPGGAM